MGFAKSRTQGVMARRGAKNAIAFQARRCPFVISKWHWKPAVSLISKFRVINSSEAREAKNDDALCTICCRVR
jgi:hypothetical protein